MLIPRVFSRFPFLPPSQNYNQGKEEGGGGKKRGERLKHPPNLLPTIPISRVFQTNALKWRRKREGRGKKEMGLATLTEGGGNSLSSAMREKKKGKISPLSTKERKRGKGKSGAVRPLLPSQHDLM